MYPNSSAKLLNYQYRFIFFIQYMARELTIYLARKDFISIKKPYKQKLLIILNEAKTKSLNNIYRLHILCIL